jgi:predicted metal-dependent peptidase
MERKRKVQTQEEWEEEMTYKIYRFVHDELYIEFRYLDIALGVLFPKTDKRVQTFATDGEWMYLSTKQMLRLFQKNPTYLNRVYLHAVLHCLFSHLWIGGKRDPFLWGIACDIAIEYTIDHMEQKSVKRILGWIRQKTYEWLEDKECAITAAQIYNLLLDVSQEELIKLQREFFADDHAFWPKQQDQNVQIQQMQNKWNKISRQTQLEQKRHGDQSEDGSDLAAIPLKVQKRQRSYRDFLRKFAVLQEELHCDEEEFDIGFYTYGLQLYQNMPLLEPLESREVHKIRDFVIIIDTSYSTKGELVESFLKETFSILCQEESFFQKAKLHVIQCDEKIQEDIVITKPEQLERLFSDFTIKGGGNTDFRPAFSYVNRLAEEGQFDCLCGLLYFTDGKGIYPKKKPDYPTAFLFLDEYEEEKVPVWAIRMQLEHDGKRLL